MVTEQIVTASNVDSCRHSNVSSGLNLHLNTNEQYASQRHGTDSDVHSLARDSVVLTNGSSEPWKQDISNCIDSYNKIVFCETCSS